MAYTFHFTVRTMFENVRFFRKNPRKPKVLFYVLTGVIFEVISMPLATVFLRLVGGERVARESANACVDRDPRPIFPA
jgi:hypothetical protein